LGKIAALPRQKMSMLRDAGAKKIIADFGRTTLNMLTSNCLLTSPEIRLERMDVYRAYPFFQYFSDALAVEMAQYFPPLRVPFTLIDKTNGYACQQIPMDAGVPEGVEEVRMQAAQALGKRHYEGFNFDIDRRYDNNSAYFVVKNEQGVVVSAGRMTYKTERKTIPTEDGVSPDGSRYSLAGQEGEIAEINSFFCNKEDRLSLMVLFASFGRYAWLMGFKKVICSVDREHEKAWKLYQKAGFRFSKIFSQDIHFPTFGRSKDAGFQPTQWTIMEMNQKYILWHALSAFRFATA
jgi:hypothetical protein